MLSHQGAQMRQIMNAIDREENRKPVLYRVADYLTNLWERTYRSLRKLLSMSR